VLRLDPGAGSINEVRERAADLARRHGSRPVCCRFSGPVREPGSTLARACAPALVVVLAESGRLAYWEEQARLHATGVKPPAGLVVADAPDLLRPA
jgi:hypothetical protein